MKSLNDKAISLLMRACNMAKKNEKSYVEADVIIRVAKDGFTILTKMCKIQAMAKPLRHEDFFMLEPFNIIIYGRKSKKTLYKGEWVNRIMTAKKVQLIKH